MNIHRSGIIHYSDPAGKERVYETVERTTRSEPDAIDGVDLISTWLNNFNRVARFFNAVALIPSESEPSTSSNRDEKHICLVVAYRAPVDRCVCKHQWRGQSSFIGQDLTLVP